MATKDELIEHYLNTLINLLSHILFGVNFKLDDNGKKYKDNLSTPNTISKDDKLKKINEITEKINNKKLKNTKDIIKKIMELNNIFMSFNEEDDIKSFYNFIMTP